MELNVYDWENFERGKVRYLVFAFFILLVVVFSILSNNIFWWLIVLILAGAYIFFITKTNNTIKMITWKKSLQIGKFTYPRESLKWFVLEYHTEKKKIHNIVIVDNKNSYKVYTIKDTEKNFFSCDDSFLVMTLDLLFFFNWMKDLSYSVVFPSFQKFHTQFHITP